MKIKKITLSIIVLFLFVVEAMGQTNTEPVAYNRQVGGDLSNFIFSRNNVTLLYRKMKSPTRAIRFDLSFYPSTYVTQNELPEGMQGTLDKKLGGNKLNYIVNPVATVVFEKWKDVSKNFYVYYGPFVGVGFYRSVQNHGVAPAGFDVVSATQYKNIGGNVSGGFLGGIAYKINNRFMLSLESSLGAQLSLSQSTTTKYTQYLATNQVTESKDKNGSAQLNTFGSFFKTLWLTYSF